RFALSYHRKLRGKALLASQLDQIVGIGEIKRTRLLGQFGSLAQLAEASDEALQEAGLNVETVTNLRKALGSSPT
ncbi:MAG: excinuclease ABC subunit C, partial [Nitrospira sp.]|nr:excinuclease ABC subunit C [Nitrospira sp.]